MLKEKKLIGQDLVSYEGGFVVRGPIKEIILETQANQEFLYIITKWSAIFKDEKWEFLVEDNRIGGDVEGLSFVKEESGIITINIMYIGEEQILPRGDKLDSAKVVGIPKKFIKHRKTEKVKQR